MSCPGIHCIKTQYLVCLGVSQLLIFVSCNVFKIIWHVKAKLMVCSLRSHTLPLQYISRLSIFTPALLMMLQRFGIICQIIYVQSLLSPHSEKSSKPISLHKQIYPNFCIFWFLSLALTPAMSQVDDFSFLLVLFGVSV